MAWYVLINVTAALPRSRKCGCGTKAAGVGAANNSSSSSSSSANTKTPRSPSKRTFYKPPLSPRSMSRSRIDPSALGRTDVSQMNIHAPPSSGGWSANGNPAPGMENMSLPGPADGGQFMLPGESMGFYTSQDGQSAMFAPASGSYAQLGYPIEDTTNSHMYSNGGDQGDLNSFFDSNMGMPGHLGDMQLGGGDAAGLGGFGLNMQSRTGQMNGMHSLAYQQTTQPPPPLPTTTTSSCCAPAAQQQQRPANDSTRHTPTSSTNSVASNGGSTTNTKSCCSGSPATASSSASHRPMFKSESVGGSSASVNLSSIPLVTSSRAANGDAKPHLANGHNGLTDQYSVSLNQQVYGGFAQQQAHANGAPTWYRYPPEYGTVTAPLQLSQWRAGLTVTSGPNAGMFGDAIHQQHQHQHPVQHQQQQAYDSATMQQAFAVQQHNGAMLDTSGGGGDVTVQDDSHMCSCGDGCECVGCVAHPYNNATRNTVQSMWSLMDDASSTASSSKTATAAVTTPTTLTSQQQQHAQTGGNVDSTSPQQQVFTPSDTSGSDDQVTLPAGDFLFVSYSIMGCEGEGLTCPCGDDCHTFEPLFAHYLDQEKRIVLADLERSARKDGKKDNKYEREIQSRWRRFVEKWNGHELHDRWYEPMLFLRVVRARDNGTTLVEKPAVDERKDKNDEKDDRDDDDDDDDYGPALPPDQASPATSLAVSSAFRSRHLGAPGPTIPSRADLDERRALDDDARDTERAALRLARRADRAEQRERLEELVPRAAAGTRERQLEKKRELNHKMRGFRDRSPGGGGLEMGDDELMGDDGGSGRKSAKDLQKEAEAAQARRTHWQHRREEEQRARDEELNERRAQYRAREEETMDMLRELARQRFG
ncbi:hypothetical protein SBRCBS47491_002841 [Sporothrix bragantina]|uniref:Uncharacterized protein n=1 Tax=Sporothrix bragantina TaxID=671064 RepID=A0ABP0BB80_9PEZI